MSSPDTPPPWKTIVSGIIRAARRGGLSVPEISARVSDGPLSGCLAFASLRDCEVVLSADMVDAEPWTIKAIAAHEIAHLLCGPAPRPHGREYTLVCRRLHRACLRGGLMLPAPPVADRRRWHRPGMSPRRAFTGALSLPQRPHRAPTAYDALLRKLGQEGAAKGSQTAPKPHCQPGQRQALRVALFALVVAHGVAA